MNRTKLKKGEKRLLVGTTGLAMLFFAAGIWWQIFNAMPVVNIPKPVMPSPNAFDFYVKAGQAQVTANPPVDRIHDTSTPASAPDSPQDLARRYPTTAKEAWLRRNAPALRLLRRGFAYEYREPPVRSFSTVLPHYGGFRELARLLAVESHAQAERGNWAGASRSALDILRLGNDVPRGGPLIAALVGSAIQAIGRKELWTTMPHLDATVSRAAAARLESLFKQRVTYADVLQEEKWCVQASLLEAMRDRQWRREFLNRDWMTRPTPTKTIRIFTTTKRQVLRSYTAAMDALIANARRPYASSQTLPAPGDPISEMLTEIFASSRWSAGRNETSQALLLVSLALRAYQLDCGTYPNQLAELVPTYLKRVPTDPFGAGGSLIYRRTGDTYTLYSIGPDGKDNGGKPIEDSTAPKNQPRRYSVQPDSIGDVVAGVNR